MIRLAVVALTLVLGSVPGAAAQEPEPAQKPAPQQQGPRPGPQPINIRIDLELTEEGEGAAPARTVTMLVADQHQGRARAHGPASALNVDARPEVLRDGRVRVMLSLEYRPDGNAAIISQSLSAVLASGKPVVVSQSADPKGTRRVKAELTATVLK
jgi:hypothetical protein